MVPTADTSLSHKVICDTDVYTTFEILQDMERAIEILDNDNSYRLITLLKWHLLNKKVNN